MTQMTQNKRLKHLFVTILLLVMLESCGTITLQSSGRVNVDSSSYTYYFTKSYPISKKDRWLCGLTAVIYGGWCWTFYSMPNDEQSAQFKLDLKEKLSKEKPGKQFFYSDTPEKSSWDEAPENLTLSPYEPFNPETFADGKYSYILKNEIVVLSDEERISEIKKYIKKNKKYKEFEKFAIEKKVVIGMPEELLFLSWKVPKSSNRTVTSIGSSIQYVYEGSVYVYVTNGFVTAFQD